MHFSPEAQQWVNTVLIWIGFGTLAGLLARAILPGRAPYSALGTVVLGIMGTTLGLFIASRLINEPNEFTNPINPIGLVAATIGTFIMIICYRSLLAIHLRFENEEEEEEEEDEE
jgi:uncharacterized membrane protein YeaQ/YmgE (transglycosylase-associated protein family)